MSDIIITIQTAIRDAHWSTVQVGEKSLQKITLNQANKEIDSEFTTGKTTFLWWKLHSIRDSFKLKNKAFEDGCIKFKAIGETATAVGLLPNINYSFAFTLYPLKKLISITGNHDGYPSYRIVVNGQVVYDFKQGVVAELAGDSDVSTNISNKSWV